MARRRRRLQPSVFAGFAAAACHASLPLVAASQEGGNSAAHQQAEEGGCLRRERSSPVNVVPQNSVPERSTDTVRLEYGKWDLHSFKRIGSMKDRQLCTLGVQGREGGRIQVGHRYNDFDEYVLQSIQVHSPSEHTFLGRRLPLEIQLWHQPTLLVDLAEVKERRQKVRKALADLRQQVSAWGYSAEQLQTVSGNYSFPSLKIETDWVVSARGRINDVGRDVVEGVFELESELKALNMQTQTLLVRLKREKSARLAVLSIFIRPSDSSEPSEKFASEFVAWITRVLRANPKGVDSVLLNATSILPPHQAARDADDFQEGSSSSSMSSSGPKLPAAGEGRQPPPAATPAPTHQEKREEPSRTAPPATHPAKPKPPPPPPLPEQDHVKARRLREGISGDSFEFEKIPFAGAIKDRGEAEMHHVLAYDGSFTTAPCTPVVRWFLSSEPLVAYAPDMVRLINESLAALEVDAATPQAAKAFKTRLLDGLARREVWWSGPVDQTMKVEPALPTRELKAMTVSTFPFEAPQAQLNSAAVAGLPWGYVHFYCAAFLVTSVAMLSMTLGLCAQQFCDIETAEDGK
eukprot:TRINITY_DN16416_c0_g1_i1.p1 TRINITY_DN16416_c0_g1~~TRINITY_DN16416_c0_g1_i1.p1  ORF type:complete len:577 (-),score=150.22 TRINITY_DN16416_c0_g1_i1:55-1785(-)